MSANLEEQAIRQEYRITGDPSWRVLKMWKGQWVVAFYCRSEAGAAEQMERCVQRAIRWAAMSDAERIASVLRS
jgi:hypothetical protein